MRIWFIKTNWWQPPLFVVDRLLGRRIMVIPKFPTPVSNVGNMYYKSIIIIRFGKQLHISYHRLDFVSFTPSAEL